jgi:Mg2+ and Co2+ transporter CorA
MSAPKYSTNQQFDSECNECRHLEAKIRNLENRLLSANSDITNCRKRNIELKEVLSGSRLLLKELWFQNKTKAEVSDRFLDTIESHFTDIGKALLSESSKESKPLGII